MIVIDLSKDISGDIIRYSLQLSFLSLRIARQHSIPSKSGRGDSSNVDVRLTRRVICVDPGRSLKKELRTCINVWIISNYTRYILISFNKVGGAI